MSGILEGLKVIDCGSFIAAAIAGTVLADFGADVIKIEPPGTGDAYRHVTRNPGMPKSEHNYGWLLDNRSKRGLALDLTSPRRPDRRSCTTSSSRPTSSSPTSRWRCARSSEPITNGLRR